MKPKPENKDTNEIISATNKDLNACVIELAESFLKDFPDSQGGWDIYSLALLRIDRFKDAQKALYKAIKLINETNKQKRLGWLYCRMGSLYEDSGKFRKAIDWFEKAHNTNPNEATFSIFIGVRLFRLEKFDEADETFKKPQNVKRVILRKLFII